MCHNLFGHEIQSRNISTRENHLHPKLCLNLKNESVVLTPNYAALTEMGTGS